MCNSQNAIFFLHILELTCNQISLLTQFFRITFFPPRLFWWSTRQRGDEFYRLWKGRIKLDEKETVHLRVWNGLTFKTQKYMRAGKRDPAVWMGRRKKEVLPLDSRSVVWKHPFMQTCRTQLLSSQVLHSFSSLLMSCGGTKTHTHTLSSLSSHPTSTGSAPRLFSFTASGRQSIWPVSLYNTIYSVTASI